MLEQKSMIFFFFKNIFQSLFIIVSELILYNSNNKHFQIRFSKSILYKHTFVQIWIQILP